MDIESLIGTMIEGSLTSRRKRSHRAGRFLRHGSGSFINASTLLTVGGLVWGAIETMQQQSAAGTGGSAPAPPRPSVPPAGPAPAATSPGRGVPPPLPPLPGVSPAPPAEAAPPVQAAEDAIPDGAARVIRLMVSAARADGQASDAERQAILEHARKVGADALVEDEWLRPTPLASVVGVVTDPQQRADLYVLAYTIVRADEGITGAERIYLARLASMLNLDRAAVERLEEETDSGIASQV